MNANRLMAHFERISDAPDAVDRLRRFILDLAVRGKLVEQDPGDESATTLRLRLKELHAQADKQTRTRSKRKGDESPHADIGPHSLPSNWVWVPIREILRDHGQMVPSKRVTYIDVTAIDKKAGTITDPRILDAVDAPSRARKIVKKGDVLYSCVRPTLLNIAVIDRDYDPEPIASTAFAVLNGLTGVVPRFTWIVLRSPYFSAEVDGKTRGQAYPAINDADFASLPFPLPPLAEQHRIVEKVDELMKLCDRLEASQQDRESRRDRLVVASLNRLSQPTDHDEFRKDARFQLSNLSRCSTKPEHIKELRKAILNLAVRGKLVEQDEREGTAETLLTQITAQLPPMKDSDEKQQDVEARWPIPTAWEWTRMKCLCSRITSGATPSQDFFHESSGVPFLKVYNIRNQQIDFGYKPQFINRTYHETKMKRSTLQPGDVVMNIVGPPLGKVAIIPDDYPEWNCNQAIAVFKLVLPELAPYAYWFLRENSFLDEIDLIGTAGQDNISVTKSQNIAIPLPPLAEQQRIVAKVDELMLICDQLENQLEYQQKGRRQFLEALLHEALEGVG